MRGLICVLLLVVGAGCDNGGNQELRQFARYKAVPPAGHQVTAQDLGRSVEIMQRRLDKLGIDGKVRRQGARVIVVEVPAEVPLHDRSAAAELLGKSALLEFYDFEADLTGPSVNGLARSPVAKPSLFELLADPATRALAKQGTPSQWYRFDANKRQVAGPARTKSLLGHLRPRETVLAVPESTVVVTCKVETGNCLTTREIRSKKGFYLVRQSDDPSDPVPELTARDLTPSGTRADIDPSSNAPVVLIQFTERGKGVFHEITRREAERGALACAGQRDLDAVTRCAQHFAIVLDHELWSVPYIDFLRNPDGIPGDNGAQIDLGPGGSIGEARRLALALQAGALPVQLVRLP